MSDTVHLEPLTALDFAPFGDVLEATGTPDKMINQGLCGRFHDLALMDFTQGRAGISLFSAEPRQLPLKLEMVERHPDGSQAFIPMALNPFIVVVAQDVAGHPKNIRAFLSAPGQGVNYHKGTWHGVLTPLHAPGLFAVVDRIGPGSNLEEYWFDHPLTIDKPK